MKIEYKVFTKSQILEREDDFANLPGDQLDDIEWFGDFDSGVFRLEDDKVVALLGSDGGEPEDQVLWRAWSWVATALQAAYELGEKHGYDDGWAVGHADGYNVALGNCAYNHG